MRADRLPIKLHPDMRKHPVQIIQHSNPIHFVNNRLISHQMSFGFTRRMLQEFQFIPPFDFFPGTRKPFLRFTFLFFLLFLFSLVITHKLVKR